MNKFKKKQRAEASELNAQTEASRRKWHQEQNPQRSKVKKVENTRKPKEEKLEGAAAVKARVQASQKPVGPKIIKPSPARNKAKRPTVKKVEPIAPVVPAPQKEEAKPTRKKTLLARNVKCQIMNVKEANILIRHVAVEIRKISVLIKVKKLRSSQPKERNVHCQKL